MSQRLKAFKIARRLATLKIAFVLTSGAIAADLVFSESSQACILSPHYTRDSIYSTKRCQTIGQRLYSGLTQCPSAIELSYGVKSLSYENCRSEQDRVAAINRARFKEQGFSALMPGNRVEPDYANAHQQFGGSGGGSSAIAPINNAYVEQRNAEVCGRFPMARGCGAR
jgi:hypothetical protein